VLKGACTGCHSQNVYATIEYFLLENFEGETGGKISDCKALALEKIKSIVLNKMQ
jgi:hypothetical protein